MMTMEWPDTEQATDRIVQNWLATRQQLIIALCQLIEQRPFQYQSTEELKLYFNPFCELLIDYVSCGHFASFVHLIETIEQHNEGKPIPPGLLDNIEQTTEQVLIFHDKYLNDTTVDTLEMDLSLLGEDLALRFEWEDRLLQHYYQARGIKLPAQKIA